MAVTISPGTEAMQAIVARINSGDEYELPVRATYSEQMIDPLEELTDLRVDVVTESEETLNETLAVEDRTSLEMRIWIRKKVASVSCDEIDPLRLLALAAKETLQTLQTAATALGKNAVLQVVGASVMTRAIARASVQQGHFRSS